MPSYSFLRPLFLPPPSSLDVEVVVVLLAEFDVSNSDATIGAALCARSPTFPAIISTGPDIHSGLLKSSTSCVVSAGQENGRICNANNRRLGVHTS